MSADNIATLARAGSPVEQGAALRALDSQTGDRRASDAITRGDVGTRGVAARDAAGTAAPETCTIEVRYKPVIGPTNHAFIVTTDADSTTYFRGGPWSNDNGLNSSRSSQGNGEAPPPGGPYGIYGPIVTERGDYRPGTTDWTTTPSGQQVVDRTNGNCDAVDARLGRAINDIEAARINYMPLDQNSNSTVREALERAGYPDIRPVVWSPAWDTQLPAAR